MTADALMPMAEADRKVWHTTLLGLHNLQKTADDAAEAVSTLSQQLPSVREAVRGSAGAPMAAIDSIGRTLVRLRQQLSVPAPGTSPGGRGGGFGGVQPLRVRIGGLKREIMNSTSLPAEVQTRGANDARGELIRLVEDVNAIIATSMPALARALAGTPAAAAIKPLKPLLSVGAGSSREH